MFHVDFNLIPENTSGAAELLLLFIAAFRVQDLYNHSRIEYGSLTTAQGSTVRCLDHLLAGMVHRCLYVHPLWIHTHSMCLKIIRFISHGTALKFKMSV